MTHADLEQLAELVVERLGMAAVSSRCESTRLLDARDASARLGVTPTWLLAQARAGKVPHRRLGHYVRWHEDDIAEIVEKARKSV